MWGVVEQIESGLLRDMQAVELATFKIANMNRPVIAGGDDVFIEMVVASEASEQFSIVDKASDASLERIPLKQVFEPESPLADENGFVQYMDVDLAKEMIEITLHKRSYELGVKLFNSAKSMSEKALSIGKQ